jgi:nucleoside-diphosphate-sugar epimerase
MAMGSVKTNLDLVQGDIRNEEDDRTAIAGMEGLIHVPELSNFTSADDVHREQEILDFHTRGTYNLMQAAVAAGVHRVVYAGTLALMESYPVDWAVTEGWRPKPRPEAWQVARYLEELILREFAREFEMTVICLRLGTVVRVDAVREQPFDPLWVEESDAIHAFRRAVSSDHRNQWKRRRWWVFHILSDAPQARFILKEAVVPPLEYRPLHDFRGWRRGDET